VTKYLNIFAGAVHLLYSKQMEEKCREEDTAAGFVTGQQPFMPAFGAVESFA